MKKYILFTLLLLFLSLGLIKAQKKGELDARYVLKSNKEDTIIAKFQCGFVNDYQLDAKFLFGNFKFKQGDKTIKVKELDLQYLEFVDRIKVKRRFITNENTPFKMTFKKLVEIVYLGKMSFFRYYQKSEGSYPSGVPGVPMIPGGPGISVSIPIVIYSPGSNKLDRSFNSSFDTPVSSWATSRSVKVQDIFYHENYDPYFFDLNKEKDRVTFASKLLDRPKLQDRMLDIENYSDVIDILEDFNTPANIALQKEYLNSDKAKRQRIKDLSNSESIELLEINGPLEIKEGEYVKYTGPGEDRFALLRRKLSSRIVILELLDKEDNVIKFKARLSDIKKLSGTIDADSKER